VKRLDAGVFETVSAVCFAKLKMFEGDDSAVAVVEVWEVDEAKLNELAGADVLGALVVEPKPKVGFGVALVSTVDGLAGEAAGVVEPKLNVGFGAALISIVECFDGEAFGVVEPKLNDGLGVEDTFVCTGGVADVDAPKLKEETGVVEAPPPILNGEDWVDGVDGANLLPNIFEDSFAGSFAMFPLVMGGTCIEPNDDAACCSDAAGFCPKVKEAVGAVMFPPNGDFAGSASLAADTPNVNEAAAG
jgi:hypothetical protein